MLKIDLNALCYFQCNETKQYEEKIKKQIQLLPHLIKKFSIMSSFISELFNFYMITCYNNSISNQLFLVNAHQMSSLGPGITRFQRRSHVGELYLLLEFWVYCNCGFSTDS